MSQLSMWECERCDAQTTTESADTPPAGWTWIVYEVGTNGDYAEVEADLCGDCQVDLLLFMERKPPEPRE